MAPSGLAILIGAGPNTGTGIARILSHPSHGNLAVALLARRPEPLQELTNSLRSSTPGAVLEAFPTDTSPDSQKGICRHQAPPVVQWPEASPGNLQREAQQQEALPRRDLRGLHNLPRSLRRRRLHLRPRSPRPPLRRPRRRAPQRLSQPGHQGHAHLHRHARRAALLRAIRGLRRRAGLGAAAGADAGPRDVGQGGARRAHHRQRRHR